MALSAFQRLKLLLKGWELLKGTMQHKTDKTIKQTIGRSHITRGDGGIRIGIARRVFPLFIVGNEPPPLFILPLQKATTGKPEFRHRPVR